MWIQFNIPDRQEADEREGQGVQEVYGGDMNNRSCTDTTKVKKAAIYRQAARLLEQKACHSPDRYNRNGTVRVKFTCCAIAEAEGIFPKWNYGEKESKLVEHYTDTFGLEGGGNWFGSDWDDRVQDHRILALCFMAAMVEAGDA
jgi:hypothetical protein